MHTIHSFDPRSAECRMGSAPIEQPCTLQAHTVQNFQQNGFVLLRDVLDASELDHWGQLIRQAHCDRVGALPPIAERDRYHQAFQQVINIWRSHKQLRPFVLNERLGSIARQLLDVQHVRPYHDQSLFKEAGGGGTDWHADQYYWPLSSTRTVPAWIPLQVIGRDMGALGFAAGSHRLSERSSMRISEASDNFCRDMVQKYDLAVYQQPFNLGDVSFHLGWTMHYAPANTTKRQRNVMTMIYMDAAMTVATPINEAQHNDLRSWLPGLAPGDVCASELNPVIGAEDSLGA